MEEISALPGREDSGGGPHAGYTDELHEKRTLHLCCKTKEGVRVFPDDEVYVDGGAFLPFDRRVGAERHIDMIADPSCFDHDKGRAAISNFSL